MPTVYQQFLRPEQRGPHIQTNTRALKMHNGWSQAATGAVQQHCTQHMAHIVWWALQSTNYLSKCQLPYLPLYSRTRSAPYTCMQCMQQCCHTTAQCAPLVYKIEDASGPEGDLKHKSPKMLSNVSTTIFPRQTYPMQDKAHITCTCMRLRWVGHWQELCKSQAQKQSSQVSAKYHNKVHANPLASTCMHQTADTPDMPGVTHTWPTIGCDTRRTQFA